MTDFNLPVPDDAPWLNLSKEEVEQLRQKKKELTEHGREKLKKLIKQGIEEYKPTLEELAKDD